MSESEISIKVLINKGLYEKLKKESQLYQEHCLKKNQQVNRKLEKRCVPAGVVTIKFQSESPSFREN